MFTGAAVGPLLAGVIESSGWNNVFYMLIGSDIMALLVSSYISYHREYSKVLENIKLLQTYISHGLGDSLRLFIRRIRNMDFFTMISFGFIFTMMFVFYLNYVYNSWQWDRFNVSKCYGIIIIISYLLTNWSVTFLWVSFLWMNCIVLPCFHCFLVNLITCIIFFLLEIIYLFNATLLQCIYNFLASVHDIDYRTNVLNQRYPNMYMSKLGIGGFPMTDIAIDSVPSKDFFFICFCANFAWRVPEQIISIR